ncbi:MAG: carboxypeptidase-like regulatory domain-containing protein [Bryobacteraceae bacterium]
MFTKMHYFLSICLSAGLAVPMWCQSNGSVPLGAMVQGRVMSEEGKGIEGATVTVIRRPAEDVGSLPPPVLSAVTDGSGVFLLHGMAAGTYRLCAQVPFSELLNPCEWETSRTEVSVKVSETKSGLEIRMVKGHLVMVNVQDPGGYLSTHLGKTRGAGFLVSYKALNRPTRPILPRNRDKVGRQYVVAVPFDRQVRFQVHSRFFSVEDDAGRALDESREIPVQAAKGNASSNITVRLKGLKN